MNTIRNILFREIRHVSKDASLFLIILLAPVLYAFMYGSIYLYKGEEKVRLALVDSDGSAVSRTLTDQLNTTPMIEIVPVSSLDKAREKMYHEDVQGFLYIPQNFEKDIFGLKQTDVNLVLNASRFLPSSDLLNTVTKVCLTVGAGVRKTYFNKQGMGEDEAMKMTNPINMDYRPLYNSGMTYGAFLLPGLLAIILQQTLLIGAAASFASEREGKRLPELFQMSGGRTSALIIGKAFFYFVVFMIFGFFFLTVNFSVLGIRIRGGGLDLAVLAALFISSIIILGMLIGSFFRSKLFTFQVMVFSSYPIFLVTGYSMPYQALPPAIQFFSDLLPTSPFLKAYISVVQAGGSLADNIPAIIHLVVLWLAFLVVLMWRIHYLKGKTIDDKN